MPAPATPPPADLSARPALLRHADRVVYLRSGRIVAEGDHAELMDLEDYREMVQR